MKMKYSHLSPKRQTI
ncbi:hypothetical protein Nmel_000142 [Mimus melanotis]